MSRAIEVPLRDFDAFRPTTPNTPNTNEPRGASPGFFARMPTSHPPRQRVIRPKACTSVAGGGAPRHPRTRRPKTPRPRRGRRGSGGGCCPHRPPATRLFPPRPPTAEGSHRANSTTLRHTINQLRTSVAATSTGHGRVDVGTVQTEDQSRSRLAIQERAMPDAADLSRIRAESIAIVERFGLSVSAQLPLIEIPATRRSQEEILDRMLVLNAVVASSFGFRNAKAIKWLEDQSLWDATSKVEKSLLRSKSNPFSCSTQREGLWAMFWALGYTQSLEFGEFCSETLADQLPNLKAAAVEDLAPPSCEGPVTPDRRTVTKARSGLLPPPRLEPADHRAPPAATRRARVCHRGTPQGAGVDHQQAGLGHGRDADMGRRAAGGLRLAFPDAWRVGHEAPASQFAQPVAPYMLLEAQKHATQLRRPALSPPGSAPSRPAPLLPSPSPQPNPITRR